LLNNEGRLPIVCTGSVFKSWNLLKPGFERCLRKHIKKSSIKYSNINVLDLVCLKNDATLGAAKLAYQLYDNKSINYEQMFSKHDTIEQLDKLYLKNFYSTEDDQSIKSLTSKSDSAYLKTSLFKSIFNIFSKEA
jgi:hypothetical protein